jgi:hypothetical protein
MISSCRADNDVAMLGHVTVGAAVAAVVGTTLLATSAALADRPLIRDAMYYVVPFIAKNGQRKAEDPSSSTASTPQELHRSRA